MDRGLEHIALNYFAAIEDLLTKRRNYELVRETAGEHVTQAAKLELAFSEKEHDSCKDAFWKAFEYTLIIYDLKDGDLPETFETVYVFDEVEKIWIKAEISTISHPGALRFTDGLQVLGSPNEYDRYTRWTRLSVLKERERFIIITGTSKPHLWYADHIAEKFAIVANFEDCYSIIKDGLPKKVYKTDCELCE